jgi:protein-S-isoprenylcysteine O-methyltransferase Ste14
MKPFCLSIVLDLLELAKNAHAVGVINPTAIQTFNLFGQIQPHELVDRSAIENKRNITIGCQRDSQEEVSAALVASKCYHDHARDSMKSFIFKLTAQTIVLFGLIAAALFISAGTIRWIEAWLFFGLFFVFFLGVSLWLFRNNPSLANERMRLGGSNQQGWDRILFPIMFISPLAWLVLTALDSMRYKWSHVPLWVEVIGGVLLIISFCLLFLTFRENSYLSPLARVQRDRGQKVISTGPYAIIRHPMYFALKECTVETRHRIGVMDMRMRLSRSLAVHPLLVFSCFRVNKNAIACFYE